MSVLKYDRVVLIKEFGKLRTVGEVYEIANITEETFILRDARTKIAVAVIDIKDFEEYFRKEDEVKTWTPWTVFNVDDGRVAFYRTNRRKVEVKYDGFKSTAYCSKGDEFNLHFGISLAYRRCLIKQSVKLKKNTEENKKACEALLEHLDSAIKDNKTFIKRMINSLDEKVEE